MSEEAKTGNIPVSPYTGIPGWETDEEEIALTELAEQVPGGGLIVELGSEYGRSAAAFLRGSEYSVELFSVDLFPDDHPVVGDLLEEYKKNIKPFLDEAPRQVGLLIGDSREAAQHWPDEKGIDLLFVDANHEYHAVKGDIEAWVPFVKVGGVVAFHDCAVDDDSHYLHKEVSRAVDEWAGRDWGEVPQVDSLRIFQRLR